MSAEFEILAVDASNVDQYGFFCYKSKPKSEGYRQKREWLDQRFAEGMKLQIVREGKRLVGFIEYVPGEFAWRAVDAPGYMVIHCMWVVGRAKKKGYGTRLLDVCVQDARKAGKQGVAMVASERPWLAGRNVFLKNGFELVDKAPPSFELLVKRFGDAPLPSFPTDWDERLARCGPGLTIVRSSQCPYNEAAVNAALDAASEAGVPARVVEMESSQQVQASAPSAYGSFSIVYDGRLLSYHLLGKEELLGRL